MTVMVDKLIKKGFVKRYRSEDDRRIVLVQLSKQGQGALTEHKKVHQNITNFWLKILSEKERADLIKIMEKIASHMK